MSRIERPTKIARISLNQTREGGAWSCDPQAIASLEVSARGTRVRGAAGFYREVVQSPDQIRRAVAGVTMNTKQKIGIAFAEAVLRLYGHGELAAQLEAVRREHDRVQAAVEFEEFDAEEPAPAPREPARPARRRAPAKKAPARKAAGK